MEGTRSDDPLREVKGDGSARNSRKGCWCAALVLLSAGIVGGYLFWLAEATKHGPPACASLSLTLVQSIPVGDFDVSPVSGAIATRDAFVRLADSASSTLDFTAMYMDLAGEQDRLLYNETEMKRFGADAGLEVFAAIKRAAERSVKMRILLGTLNSERRRRASPLPPPPPPTWTSPTPPPARSPGADPLNSTEVRELLTYPTVEARTFDPEEWYGGGIMHLKVWHKTTTHSDL